jgi:hypothetical protein
LKVSTLPFHLGVSSYLNFFLGLLGVPFHFILEGLFHLSSMEFILPHLDSSSFNNDEELIEEIAADD